MHFATMKRNITVALDATLLKRARAVAAQRGRSISALLADELRELVARERAYEQAQGKALAYLDNPYDLGGTGIGKRDSLYDRKVIR